MRPPYFSLNFIKNMGDFQKKKKVYVYDGVL